MALHETSYFTFVRQCYWQPNQNNKLALKRHVNFLQSNPVIKTTPGNLLREFLSFLVFNTLGQIELDNWFLFRSFDCT